jgi:hypothetical protein
MRDRHAYIPATNGQPSTRGFTMYSALKFIAASVIVALFGGFLLAGVLTTQHEEDMEPAVVAETSAPATTSEALSPSGIEILTPSTGATERLVADGDGHLWSFELPGRLVRFEPDTHATTEWTLADDIVFSEAALGGGASIAPAAGGGVWLAGPDAVRLFDGDHFVQVITAPEPLRLVFETDDGSLWAATRSGVVLHWDGSTWEDVGPEGARGCDWIYALEIDSAGRLWAGGRGYQACKLNKAAGELLVLEGSEWTHFDESDASPLGSPPRSIVEIPDGSIWVASEDGLARFDGTSWAVETPAGGHPYSSLAASPDGSVWTHSDNRTGRVWRRDGAEWTKLDGPRGLPEGYWDADFATIDDRVFMGTIAGTYERVGDGWELAWDVVEPRENDLGYVSPPRLLATDDDELWVGDTEGVHHLLDGTWADELDWTTTESSVRNDLALGPDGAVWVAGPDGIAYTDGERWTFIDGRQTSALTVDAGGTVWAVRTRKSGRCHVWAIREADNGAWVREDTDGCPVPGGWRNSLAVDGDGTLWLGSESGFVPGGLARYADGEWEVVEKIGDTAVSGGNVLGTDNDGAVWIIPQQFTGTENVISYRDGPMARFDGDDFSIVELPSGASPLGVLAPDGMPWVFAERGPARFDGQTWQYPYADEAIPWMQVGAIAAYGSLYGVSAGDIIRLPARK